MRNFLGAVAGAVLGAIAFAGSANAATIIAADCISVTHVDGCLFDQANINSGDNGPNSYLAAQNLYNLFNDTHPTAQPDITLNILFASNDPGFMGDVTGITSGTWTLPENYLVNFFAVKASNAFVLYQIDSAFTHSWDTFDIPFNQNPHELSHLVFFGSVSAVPEPSTWAMMILGFGAVGWSLRRQRRQAVLTI
jgi:hypothetical protein